MANNRLWLCHRPTGLAAYLGKRMGWGWHGAEDVSSSLTLLYELIEQQNFGAGDAGMTGIDYDALQDDFVVLHEGDDMKWQYGEQILPGVRHIHLPEVST